MYVDLSLVLGILAVVAVIVGCSWAILGGDPGGRHLFDYPSPAIGGCALSIVGAIALIAIVAFSLGKCSS